MSDQLLAAALAYGEANLRYKTIYEAWRKAHPNEAAMDGKKGFSVLDDPSWQAEVQPACRAVNDAARRITTEAERLYTESLKKETP